MTSGAAMPAVFFGHGSPMNAIDDNAYTRAWAEIGASLPRPSAILAVSAHWYVPGLHATAAARPRTIHDFGGFPRPLYEVEYGAPGAPALVERLATLLAPANVARDERWGLDHGTWSVLVHAYPRADVPVVQLALDRTLPPQAHAALARRLTPLRDEGVLVAGFGNVVHNLGMLAWNAPGQAYDWAQRFDDRVRALLVGGDDEALAEYETLGDDARLSVPTPEHYLPLLYVNAMRRPGDAVTFPTVGFDMGSISMLSVRIG